MRIEVVAEPGKASTVKGNLLEKLAADFLRAQSYQVESQVRLTATELDLLAVHLVDGRRIYAECKAYRDSLSANVLRNLLGTVEFHEYDQGWLICAGPLGKDAKGFQTEWELRPPQKRARLSIYTPERLVEALKASGVVAAVPESAAKLAAGDCLLGEWVLLLSEYGRFWSATLISDGIPASVLVFDAPTGSPVSSTSLLAKLEGTDTSLSNLSFIPIGAGGQTHLFKQGDGTATQVVQVQYGESWSDYRPARPKDFIGRREAQDTVLNFLEAVKDGNTSGRVFALTGDSGLGKSSLVTKIVSRCQNIRHRNRYMSYAVDVRAAQGPEYINAALVACLRSAAERGFGETAAGGLAVSVEGDPLSSPSIQKYLESLRTQDRVICLILDQFEELYSKPDLFAVFERARQLFLSASGAGYPFVLGFAWRTDATVPQDHPAYYLWHNLSDHRLDIGLLPFSHREATQALALFERELGRAISPSTRRQILESSRGLPWLLKKLCIHLYQQIESGEVDAETVDTLSVASLFDQDLKSLSPGESACIKAIAAKAPADWYEVLEQFGSDIVSGLQRKRLIVRSGDRVNLYWDIFREYLLTQKVPSVPFTYIPSAPSVGALFRVAGRLPLSGVRDLSGLQQDTGLVAGTVQNITHDLVMFGIARRVDDGFAAHQNMESVDEDAVASRAREVLRRHALYLRLSVASADRVWSLRELETELRKLNPAASHRTKTWRMYAERLARWLEVAGLLSGMDGGWIVQDAGRPQLVRPLRRRTSGVFTGGAPPETVVGALDWLSLRHRSDTEIAEAGFKNAISVLRSFGLAERQGKQTVAQADRSPAEAVFLAAKQDATVLKCVEIMAADETLAGKALGERLRTTVQGTWKDGSNARIGNGLARWARWVASESAGVPPFPTRWSGGRNDAAAT